MKLKLKILVLIISFLSVLLGGNIKAYAIDGLSETDINLKSETAPSESFLDRSKKSMALDMQGVSSSSPTTFSSNPFSDPTNDSDDIGLFPEGNMGASPIGDVTLPMILSLILLFFVYRGVTINKRKNL